MVHSRYSSRDSIAVWAHSVFSPGAFSSIVSVHVCLYMECILMAVLYCCGHLQCMSCWSLSKTVWGFHPTGLLLVGYVYLCNRSRISILVSVV